MAAQTFRLHGLKELDKSLGELPKATGKNVLRRVGRKALEPIIEDAKGKVAQPGASKGYATGQLRDSLAVSTRLSRRQRSMHRKLVADGRASVEVHAGAEALPHAHLVEYGTVHMEPQPFMRPAWDAGQQKVLDDIKDDLWAEIEKSAKRLRRKQQKQTRQRLGLG